MKDIVEDIVDSRNKWLKDNRNITVPYSMTDGFWNVLIDMLRLWGFDIVRIDDEI